MSAETTFITEDAAAYLTGNPGEALSLATCAGEYAGDFDMAAADADYLAEVAAILKTYRPEWQISGDFITGPAPAQHLTEDELLDLRDELQMIDAAAILTRHER